MLFFIISKFFSGKLFDDIGIKKFTSEDSGKTYVFTENDPCLLFIEEEDEVSKTLKYRKIYSNEIGTAISDMIKHKESSMFLNIQFCFSVAEIIESLKTLSRETIKDLFIEYEDIKLFLDYIEKSHNIKGDIFDDKLIFENHENFLKVLFIEDGKIDIDFIKKLSETSTIFSEIMIFLVTDPKLAETSKALSEDQEFLKRIFHNVASMFEIYEISVECSKNLEQSIKKLLSEDPEYFKKIHNTNDSIIEALEIYTIQDYQEFLKNPENLSYFRSLVFDFNNSNNENSSNLIKILKSIPEESQERRIEFIKLIDGEDDWIHENVPFTLKQVKEILQYLPQSERDAVRGLFNLNSEDVPEGYNASAKPRKKGP